MAVAVAVDVTECTVKMLPQALAPNTRQVVVTVVQVQAVMAVTVALATVALSFVGTKGGKHNGLCKN